MARETPRSRRRPVPAWMMSFSDMMTNLLCFFILMVALSSQQEAGFVDAGIGSYLERLEALGLPGLLPSRRTLIPRDSPLARYRPPRIDPLDRENWVEHVDKMIDEEFDRLRHGSAATEEPGAPFTIPLGVRFSRGSDRLTLGDRENLRELALSLRTRPGTIEVFGSCRADEESSARGRLDLSLKRARAVARYLQRFGLPPERLIAVGFGLSEPGFRRGSGTGTRRLVALRLRLE